MKPLKTLMMTAGALAMTISLAAASELKIVWYVDNDQEEANTRALLDQYTKLHPDTTFDLEITPYDGMVQKFQQYAASGIMPDLSLTSSMEPVIRPFLVDLNKEIGPEWINDFVKGWGDGAKLDDKVIAAPLRVTSTGVFLNVDAFKKALPRVIEEGLLLPVTVEGWKVKAYRHRDTGSEIEVLAPVRIPEPRALAPHHADGGAATVVGSVVLRRPLEQRLRVHMISRRSACARLRR